MDNDITIGELVRSVNRLAQVVERQEKLYVLRAVHAADMAALQGEVRDVASEVDEHDEDHKALFRLTVGALVSPFVLILLQVLLVTHLA